MLSISRIVVSCCLLGLTALVAAQNVIVDLSLSGETHALVQDIDGDRIYISIPEHNEVVVISTIDYSIEKSILVGSQPRGLDISDDGSQLFVALYGAGAVAVVDLATEDVHLIDVALAMGSSLAWDVAEVSSGKLLVTGNPGSGGLAKAVMVNLGVPDSVADNRFIRSRPVIEADRARGFAYIGEGFSPNSLYKLDVTQPDMPLVLEDGHGTVSGTQHIELSPDGARLHTASGQVLHTSTFTTAALVDAGITGYGDSSDEFHVARIEPPTSSTPTPVTVTTYEATFFTDTDIIALDCSATEFSTIKDLVVVPDGGGFLVLHEHGLCGTVESNGSLDGDGDSVSDSSDNCPDTSNPLQTDTDGDGRGDVCDPFPEDIDNLGACLIELDDSESGNARLTEAVMALQAEVESLRALLGTEFIVDNQDSNTSSTGTWRVSSGSDPWIGQSVYNNGDNTFRWTPNLPIAGTYAVYAWWTFHSNRSDSVPYRIGHSEGVSGVVVNQHDASQAGQWVLLGNHEFESGNAGYVEVSSENGQVSADAVRFVLQ